jgi:eukaryotic-like serine/threonine-protein kinase
MFEEPRGLLCSAGRFGALELSTAHPCSGATPAKVVHRDLKPANVMISKQGETKLMDFGIAKYEDLERLTQLGHVLGTPSYMSPEQISGSHVDARTDLYSLGVVLYEALTGVKPFTGATVVEIFSRVVSGRHRPLRRAAPHTPRPLRALIATLMAAEPRRRFQDATSARQALERLVASTHRSPEAVLVGFLRSRDRVTESQAFPHLAAAALEPTAEASGGAARLGWLPSLAAGLALGLGLVTSPAWWPAVRAAAAWLRWRLAG